jgi:hypothetical protein
MPICGWWPEIMNLRSVAIEGKLPSLAIGIFICRFVSARVLQAEILAYDLQLTIRDQLALAITAGS